MALLGIGAVNKTIQQSWGVPVGSRVSLHYCNISKTTALVASRFNSLVSAS